MKRNGKVFKKTLGIVLSAAMLVSGMTFMPGSAVEVQAAANTIYTVTGTETADFIAGVFDGTQKNTDGAMYQGILFPTGTYDYTFAGDLAAARAFSVEVSTGANVTIHKGIDLQAGADWNFKGAGSFAIDGASYSGIQSSASTAKISFTDTNFTIKNTPGFGIYMLSGGQMNISGGTFKVTACGINRDEGGFEFDSGTLNITNGAHVTAEGNGGNMFGDMYLGATVLVSGNDTTLTVNATTGARYGMVLPGSGASLTVDNHAVVTVNQTSGIRGINASSNDTSTINIKNGGELHVKGSSEQSGIRRTKVSVSGDGILDISGFTYALDGSLLNAGNDSFVTLNGSSMDNSSIPFLTGGTNGSTITGGSISERPASSVVNGLMTALGTNRVTTAPVNAAGEKLTRFDLTGKANSDISVAADSADSSNHPAYTYSVGADHDGTAYVWAPAVTVNFWPSAVDYAAKTQLIQTNYTIRGNKLSDVGGSAPAAPAPPIAGTAFSGWVDAATNQPFDPTTAAVTKNVDVYPAYAVVTSADIPIDILEKKVADTDYVNGPINVNIGDRVTCKTTIDMSQISAIAASYQGSTGYITGNFTMTVRGTAGHKPTETFTSSDINDYFEGGAIQLFELTGAPSYDASTNTLTFPAKVRNQYGTTGITGTELAAIMNQGIIGKTSYTATVNGEIAAPGYARLIATFDGALNYRNASYTKNFTINMTGTQADPEHLADPTLGQYGTDPLTTVSATTLYTPPVVKTGSLLVSKTIKGEGADAGREFTFALTLSDTSINGEYGDAMFAEGYASFTLKGGESIIVTGLPVGTGYTVKETASDHWTADADTKVGTIAEGQAVAEFVNTYTAEPTASPSPTASASPTVSASASASTSASASASAAAGTPKTGDDSNLFLWGLLASGALLCIISIIVYQSKHKKEQ